MGKLASSSLWSSSGTCCKLIEFLDRTDEEHNDGQLAAVVLPEIIPARPWQALLHNQGALLVKAALLYRQRMRGYQRIIIDVPFHMKR
jgi:hypothetical protein